MRIELDEVGIVVEYVHQLRRRHSITPGPSAKGLESDEYGEVGEFVYVDLICFPDFTGPWQRLSDPEYRNRVISFVQGEIARHERWPHG